MDIVPTALNLLALLALGFVGLYGAAPMPPGLVRRRRWHWLAVALAMSVMALVVVMG